MTERKSNRQHMRVLVVDDELRTQTAEGRAIGALLQELQDHAVEIVEAISAADGTSVMTSDSAIHAVLVDWNLGDDGDHEQTRAFIRYVRSRNDRIPIFLKAERREAGSLSV